MNTHGGHREGSGRKPLPIPDGELYPSRYPRARYCMNCPGKKLSMYNPDPVCFACASDNLNARFRDSARTVASGAPEARMTRLA